MKNKESNILFLNHVAALGGAERSLSEVVFHFASGNQVRPHVALPPGGALNYQISAAEIPVLELPFQRLKKTFNPFLLCLFAINVFVVGLRLKKYIYREDIDLLHCNSTTAAFYGVLAAKWTGTPCVWHCRDIVYLGLFGKWLAKRVTKIIAISETVKANLRLCGAEEKITVINNGIDPEKINREANECDVRREFGINRQRPVIGMAGNFVPWKNHEFFLDTAAAVLRKVPEAYFFIVGADLFGDNPAYEQRLVRKTYQLSLNSRIRFTGFRYNVASMLATMNLMVHPTACEPFGRIIVEGMAVGTPVVAVNRGGPSEIIEHETDGILIEPNDVSGATKAVLRVLNDADLNEQIVQNGRTKVENHYHVRDNSRKVLNLYEEILQQA